MAKGKIKRIANLDPKKWSNGAYFFVKVEGAWSGKAEEYLLITDREYADAAERAAKNPEDIPDLGRGVFTRVDNTSKKAGADDYYLAFRVLGITGEDTQLMFTEEAMDRIRERVEANPEDIEANKTGWLADLLD
jgi:hypothetical protein